LEDLGLDGMVLKHVQKRNGGVNCIHLAQDRDKLWDSVDTIMNLWVP